MKNILFTSVYKIEFLLLLIGCLLLGFHNFVLHLALNTQMIILLVMVFFVGVPHGALDFLVDEQNEEVLQHKFSLQKFVKIYLVRLFAFSLIWIFPWLAISIFLIFSIYHFGETDMATMLFSKKNAAILYIAYGTFMLVVLLLTHLSEIKDTLPVATSFITKSNIYVFLEQYKKFLFAGSALFFIATILYHQKQMNINLTISKVLIFFILMLIVILLPLLLAFTFYFAIWHSVLSVRNIFVYFKSCNNNKKFSIICNKSILFSLLALGGMVVIYFVLDYFLPNMNMLFALLILLSVLTLPHLKVMHRMYLNIDKNKSIVSY